MIAEQAPAIPWVWDKTRSSRRKNVSGVAERLLHGLDLSYTSLK